jgi:hypothetical protein
MVPKNWGKVGDSISCAVMRPVSGFDRPGLQWLFIALGIVLVIVAVIEAVGLRRLRHENATLRAADRDGRIERQELQAKAAREQSAREALSLQIARLRGGTRAGVSGPTLTLSPLLKRGPSPPEPTVELPSESQPIQLRLLLPRGQSASAATYVVVVRTWSGGEMVWSRGGVRASTVEGQPMVTAFITGDVFAPGVYEVTLATRAPDGKESDVAAYEVAVRPPRAHSDER